MVTVEVIPVNKNKQIIEKDVQSLFKPFNIMFALFFCSKYRIRNDVIHTNSLFYKVVSGICCLAIFIGYCISVFIKIFTIHLEGINYSKFCYNITVCALFFSGYTLIYYTHVIESNRNVLLMYKIQNIYKIVKTRGVFVKNFIKYNWIGVAVVALYQLLWILFFTIAFASNYEYYEVIANYVYVIFDLTGLYCVRIMRIIREPLRLWLDDVKNVQHVDHEGKASFWNKMLRIYLETLDAYQVAARTIQPGVSLIFNY
ncbi:hypothetical protein B5X24_HaOG200724 [Helicoverpa armigera]|uniref:Gustatory receptor n=1 Tax=Helicoverpa armigera TaxID=29058 RepID=A0A2W1BTW7_HELAM|nr:hypothetical protein B5X24_HaOG200724 [Helicoverpa armigera]